MAFSYSGSVLVSRGMSKVFSDDTYYSFKTTEKCRIGVDGDPLVWVKSEEEFIIKVGATYMFDRDSKLLLSYPVVDNAVDPNLWEKQSTSHITENSTLMREYDTTAYHVTVAKTGTATITFGAHAWSQNTNTLDTNWYVTHRTATGETRLINNYDFDLPANSGWNYVLHSQSSIPLTVAKDDIIALSFIGDRYVQVGSDASQDHGQFLRIEWN